MSQQRKSLERSLDNITRNIVIVLSPKCVICGGTDFLEIGHLFTRSNRATRWDYKAGGNNYTQCHLCNMRHEEDSRQFAQWYLTRFGREKYDNLKARTSGLAMFTTGDLQCMLEERREYYRNLKNLIIHNIYERN